MRMYLIKIYTCLICLFLSSNLFGQPSKSLTIRVKVVDRTGQPVAGAEVTACENICDYADGRIRTPLLDEQSTDTDGISLLEVKFERRRYVVIAARKPGLAIGWDCLPENSVEPTVTMVLDDPMMLAGTVVDENGKGIGSAEVRAVLATSSLARLRNNWLHGPESWLTIKTDVGGNFRFDDVPADVSADFFIEAAGYASICTSLAWDNLAGYQFAAGRTDIRIELQKESRIEGQVVDTAGRPVAGIRLLARPDLGNANYSSLHRSVSGKDGHFIFTGVRADTYSLQVVVPRDEMAEWVGKDTQVVCQTGQTKDDVIITVSKGGMVDLNVQDAATHQPLSDIWFSVSQEAVYGRHPGINLCGRTDAKGRARIRAPLGPCRVSAGGSGYSVFRLNPAVTVTDDKVSPLEILLDRDPVVSGTVRDESGSPIAGATVEIKPLGHEAVRTDKAGKFEVSYRSRDTWKCVLARYTERNLAAIAEISDKSVPLDITLKPGMILAGRVTDPRGTPISAARVELDARLPGWIINVGEEAITDNAGRYEIKTLPAEQKNFTYRINASALGYGPLVRQEISFSDASGDRREVKPLVLLPANVSISGVVVDAEGKPVPGRLLFLTGPRGGGGQPHRMSATDEEGEFSIGRICEGPLRLQAGYGSDPGGAGFLDAAGGDREVKIILGQKLVHSRLISLCGKPLPDLQPFQLTRTSEKIRDQSLLLCFFDMNQRSSRHSINKLKGKSEELRQKGIDIIAVQAAPIDEDRWKDWVQKNQIKFSTGRIDSEIEKTREAWGVKSLPWLILTDAEHTVRAEGFGIDELDEKIKKKQACRRRLIKIPPLLLRI